MDFFGQLFTQFKAVFGEMSASRRIFVGLVLLGSIIGLSYLTMIARADDYVPLYTELSEADISKMDLVIRSEKITPRYNQAHTTILVPAKEKDRLWMMLASQGLPQGGSLGYDVLNDIGPFASKEVIATAKLRAMQGELARSIMQIEQVEQARVLLAMPEPSPFANEQNEPSASVSIKVRRGVRLSRDAVGGIVHLVGHAIPGMRAENVTVVDGSGSVLNQAATEEATVANANLALKREHESELQNNIQTMLDQSLGKGRSVVRVNAEMDFTEQLIINETIDPESTATITELNKTEGVGLESVTSDPEGVAGAGANLPGEAELAASLSQQAANGSMSITTQKTNVVSKESTTKKIAPGVLIRVAVSALIDYKRVEGADADGNPTVTYEAWTTAQQTDLEAAIRAAGNLDEDTRGDLLEVKFMQFANAETAFDDTASADISALRTNRMIQFGVKWGVIAILGILFFLFVLRPMVRTLGVAPSVRVRAGGATAQLGADGAQQLSMLNEALPAGSLPPSVRDGAAAEDIVNLLSQQPAGPDKTASSMLRDELSKLSREDPSQAAALIKKWLEG